MSVVLEEEPLVLEQADDAIECGFLLCKERAVWSTIWTCGETTSYCDPHLRWAQRTQPVSCACPGVVREINIFIVMVVPL
ncbi:hypothetical protein SEA_SADLAD_3 [Microbacterium phage SadLad]|nr:hypothetical protein SEA_SADLAD_3 [Microbacterium phage SadLad]